MHIDNISLHIPQTEFSEILGSVAWPEGITLLDSQLGEQVIELLVKMTSYFGIPIKIRMELQSYKGSKILFKVTPPLRPFLAKDLSLPISENSIYPKGSYTLAELDILEVSKGRIKNANITDVDISSTGISVTADDITAYWRDLLQQGLFTK